MSPLFYLKTHIRRYELQPLVDSGAADNFMSEAVARRLKLTLYPLRTGMFFHAVNGEPVPAKYYVRVWMVTKTNRGHLNWPVTLKITPMTPEIILGLPFLSRHNPVIDWQAKTLTFLHGNRPHVIQAEAFHPREKFTIAAVAFPNDPKPLPPASPSLSIPFEDPSDLDVKELTKLADQEADPFGKELRDGKPKKPKAVAPVIPPDLKKLISEYSDVFPEALPTGLPPARATDHAIHLLPASHPPRHRIYRVPNADKAELKKTIDDLLLAGHIERAQSPYGAGVLFVPKKDGTKRMVVDYRGLNNITVKDIYRTPRIDEALDRMRGAKYFSKLDLRSGFYQVRIKPGHEDRTAFQTEWGSFQFKVMPFGLANAPATFQRTMDMAFQDFSTGDNPFTTVYMDDIVIFSKTWKEHVAHVKKVLQRLSELRLYVKASKCEWGLAEIDFVGFRVGAHGVATQPEKIEALKTWKTPKNIADIRSFAGFANFYQKFVPNYAHLMAPISNLLKKETPWTWGADQENAFQAVKTALINSATLAFPNPDQPFILHTDASLFAVGATLSQLDNKGEMKLLACFSKKLNPAEKNYPAHERELFALVLALKHWKVYLWGTEVIAYTDSTFLKYLKTRDITLSGRQARWIQVIENYNLTIHHIPGTTNSAADALSRDPELMPVMPVMPLVCPVVPAQGGSVPAGPAYEDWIPDYKNDPYCLAAYFGEDGELKDPTQLYHGKLWYDD